MPTSQLRATRPDTHDGKPPFPVSTHGFAVLVGVSSLFLVLQLFLPALLGPQAQAPPTPLHTSCNLRWCGDGGIAGAALPDGIAEKLVRRFPALLTAWERGSSPVDWCEEKNIVHKEHVLPRKQAHHSLMFLGCSLLVVLVFR